MGSAYDDELWYSQRARDRKASEASHKARQDAFDKWWKLSTHNGTLPEHRQSLAREAYYAAWGGAAQLVEIAETEGIAQIGPAKRAQTST